MNHYSCVHEYLHFVEKKDGYSVFFRSFDCKGLVSSTECFNVLEKISEPYYMRNKLVVPGKE